MERIKTHFFPVSGDRVVTGLLPAGVYVATCDDVAARGVGATRLEAIADLVEKKHAYCPDGQ